jgi:hypothetical protein
MLIDPSICELKDLSIDVDAKGFTRVVEGGPANVRVGTRTDAVKFLEFYLKRVAP